MPLWAKKMFFRPKNYFDEKAASEQKGWQKVVCVELLILGRNVAMENACEKG